jgi:hypothetical protein
MSLQDQFEKIMEDLKRNSTIEEIFGTEKSNKIICCFFYIYGMFQNLSEILKSFSNKQRLTVLLLLLVTILAFNIY